MLPKKELEARSLATSTTRAAPASVAERGAATLRFLLPPAWRPVEQTLLRHLQQIREVRVRDGALYVELADDAGFVALRPDPDQLQALFDAA